MWNLCSLDVYPNGAHRWHNWFQQLAKVFKLEAIIISMSELSNIRLKYCHCVLNNLLKTNNKILLVHRGRGLTQLSAKMTSSVRTVTSSVHTMTEKRSIISRFKLEQIFCGSFLARSDFFVRSENFWKSSFCSGGLGSQLQHSTSVIWVINQNYQSIF